MKELHTCELCGAALPTEQLYHFDGQDLCAQCLDNHTLFCRHCGERIWESDNAGTSDMPLCQSCFDDHYTNCCRCGSLIRESSAYYEEGDEYDERPYCLDCFHTLSRDKPIHDYYYKPEPIFQGEGPRFFGVELELDQGGEEADNARDLLDIANANHPLMYIKHDGSLDDGLELVTHPLSLDWQLHTMPWDMICKKALQAIARVLYFFEKHWEELLKFSRRTQRQLERWAARYGYKEHPMDILDFAKKGYHGGRYTCVNLQNPDTVEFRMFRGTLKTNTILATLQLVDQICSCAVCLNDVELKSLAWTSFVSGCQQPELIQYLKERRLYVNEPVESEEES